MSSPVAVHPKQVGTDKGAESRPGEDLPPVPEVARPSHTKAVYRALKKEKKNDRHRKKGRGAPLKFHVSCRVRGGVGGGGINEQPYNSRIVGGCAIVSLRETGRADSRRRCKTPKLAKTHKSATQAGANRRNLERFREQTFEAMSVRLPTTQTIT